MSSTMKKVPTTEQLMNEDGVLDEKAAGQAIDRLLGVPKQEKSKVDDSIPTKDDPNSDGEAKASEADASKDSQESDDPGIEDWMSSEDVVDLIESLGYSEEDMSEFTGPDEFQRHVRLMDREIKRSRPGDEPEHALQADEIARQKQERSNQLDEQYRKDGKFAKKPTELPKLDPDEFDERLVAAMEARDAKIAELEERLNGTSQNAILSDFDSIVDTLGYDELFGNSESPTSATSKTRERLFEEYKQMFNYLEAQGRPVSGKKTNRAIVLRALNLEFADELKKLNRQALVSKAKRQGAKKTGSSRRSSHQEYDGPPERDPVLKAAYEAFQAENG